jgi:hypothetical protein
MRAHRPDVPLGAFRDIPSFLPLGPDTDPLAVLTKVTLLGVDRDATDNALRAQVTVWQANPKLATEWAAWVEWCRDWQDDVTDRLNEKTHLFRANDDASHESSEFEYVKAQLLEQKLAWAQAGAAQMGYPQAPPKGPEKPPSGPTGPGGPTGPTPPQDKPGTAAEDTNWPLVLGLLAAAGVAFYVAKGDR